jgi:MoxR-like ATPase
MWLPRQGKVDEKTAAVLEVLLGNQVLLVGAEGTCDGR